MYIYELGANILVSLYSKDLVECSLVRLPEHGQAFHINHTLTQPMSLLIRPTCVN